MSEVGTYRCNECGSEYPALGSVDPSNPRVQVDGFMLLANPCPMCGGQASTVSYPPGSFGANPPIPILEAGARTGKSTDDPRAGMGIGEPGDPMYTLQSGKQHAVFTGDVAGTLKSNNGGGGFGSDPSETFIAAAYNLRGREGGTNLEPIDLASLRAGSGGSSRTYVGVRHLTPRECERLQGFPDDYTAIQYRGKLAADGPRYKALGNSMAVPVIRWIGKRIMEEAK